MNLISLKIAIEKDIKNLLTKVNLYKGLGVKNIGEHSDEFKKISRKSCYLDIYNTAIKNYDYEILLKDDSIFQFSLTRYSFIQNPCIIGTKEDLLSHIYGENELLEFDDTNYNMLLNSISEDELEQYRNEQSINIEAHSIRYDIDEKNYKPLIHSYSHIHIGPNGNLRIPCSKELSPIAFVLFVIKHTYPDINEVIYKGYLPNKGNVLHPNFWNKEEEKELFLI
ncbi:MAG: DUF2290 domain-containing protein [Prevotella sp.]|jgi:hypothetical protein|nr:DUF2290 domain-containing protein [Prevotella sp.]